MLFRLVCALVLVGGLAAPLKASLISGTGGSTTNAQLAGGSLINFDTTAAGDYATLTINNVTFTGVDAPITIGPDFIGQYNNTGINSLFNGFDYVPTAFLIEFASPVKAFGFNWGAADSNWVLSAFNSASALIETHVIAPTFGSNNGDYYGIAAADISFVTLSVVASSTLGDDDYVFIDDFVTVTGDGVVPEPATLLVWAGLAAVGTTVYVVRRNKA